MRNAMQAAGIANAYKLTEHAIKRAVERLGIAKSQAVNYVNQLMRTAYLQGIEGNKNGISRIYDHYESRTRIITNESGDVVITVYKFREPLDKTMISTDFLVDTLEREKRKLHRLYTPQIRRRELKYAELLQELADMALNRAKARNPNTRDLIAERMSDKLADAERVMRTIERLNDEWQAKVRAIEVISE